MSGSPMDPERLESLFGLLRSAVINDVLTYSGVDVADLLADRDHWEAVAAPLVESGLRHLEEIAQLRREARRFRDRCLVTAADAKRAGVTWDQCYAVFMRGAPTHRAFLAGLLGAGCTSEEAADPGFPLPTPDDPWEPIAGCVHYLEMFTPGDRWDILDEMAKGAAR